MGIHLFVQYAAQYAKTGSLREIFVNYLCTQRAELPRDDNECKVVIEEAIKEYFKHKL